MNTDFPAPIVSPEQRVLPEWIDYNGHMNVAYYVLAFDNAVETYLDSLGLGESYVRSGVGTTFALQSNVRYLGEVKLGDPLRITLQLLDYSEKCTHYFMHMYHAEENYLAATAEQLNVHIAYPDRRSAPFPEAVREKLAMMLERHRELGPPEGAGVTVGIRRR